MTIHQCINTCVNNHSKVLEYHLYILTHSHWFDAFPRRGKIVNCYSHCVDVCMSYLISWERKSRRERESDCIYKSKKRKSEQFIHFICKNKNAFFTTDVFDNCPTFHIINNYGDAFTLLVVIGNTSSRSLESSNHFFIMVAR